MVKYQAKHDGVLIVTPFQLRKSQLPNFISLCDVVGVHIASDKTCVVLVLFYHLLASN